MTVPSVAIDLARRLGLRRGEGTRFALAGLMFFFVLLAWYVLRPIRAEMAVAGGIDNLPWLFSAVLLLLLVVNPLFSKMTAICRVAAIVPLCYRAMIACLLMFFIAASLLEDGAGPWLGRVFFIWASLFSLFVVSVFWASMVDIFTTEQGVRLFGVISVGGSLGGIAGSQLAGLLVEYFEPLQLSLLSALALECAVQLSKRLRRHTPSLAGDSRPEASLGGSALEGLTRIFHSPLLRLLTLYFLCFPMLGTLLYFTQLQLVSQSIAESVERVAYFSRIDTWTQIATLVNQGFLAALVLRLLSVRVVLMLYALCYALAFAVLALAPELGALMVVLILMRSLEYGIAKPARETVFTRVQRVEKYKSKLAVDTLAFRVGDQLGAWSWPLLTAAGFGTGTLFWPLLPVALLMAWVGSRLAPRRG